MNDEVMKAMAEKDCVIAELTKELDRYKKLLYEAKQESNEHWKYKIAYEKLTESIGKVVAISFKDSFIKD